MERFQLENIYKANGLNDYQLKTTYDLLKVHGIDFEDINGYDDLTDENKAVYGVFIVNFFNLQGFYRRMRIIPRRINFVEEIEFLVKEEPSQDYYNYAGEIITKIDKKGIRKIIRKHMVVEYAGLKKIEKKPEYYLRFEYQCGEDEEGNPYNEWLHVTHGGTQWY